MAESERSLIEKMIRALLDKYFYGKRQWQWFFEKCHSVGMSGMNHGSVEIALDGELVFLNALQSETKGQNLVIFDVGASDGAYTLHVLNIFGPGVEVHCFEPSKRTQKDLSERLAGRANVRIHCFGLGDVSGQKELHAMKLGSVEGSIHDRNFPDSPFVFDKSEWIDIRTIDDVCREFNVPFIDFLKVDTEGHELFVLQGAKKMIEERRIRRIQFEFGDASLAARTYFIDMYRLLAPKYRLYRILRDGLQSVEPYRLHLEVFITANYVAILRQDENLKVHAG